MNNRNVVHFFLKAKIMSQEVYDCTKCCCKWQGKLKELQVTLISYERK